MGDHQSIYFYKEPGIDKGIKYYHGIVGNTYRLYTHKSEVKVCTDNGCSGYDEDDFHFDGLDVSELKSDPNFPYHKITATRPGRYNIISYDSFVWLWVAEQGIMPDWSLCPGDGSPRQPFNEKTAESVETEGPDIIKLKPGTEYVMKFLDQITVNSKCADETGVQSGAVSYSTTLDKDRIKIIKDEIGPVFPIGHIESKCSLDLTAATHMITFTTRKNELNEVIVSTSSPQDPGESQLAKFGKFSSSFTFGTAASA
jgi:hypothetical protein